MMSSDVCFPAQVYPDGSGYEGEFLSDQWHGLGKFTFAGGQTHTGEFKLGYSDGVVAVTDADEGIEEMWVKYQQGHRLGSSSALFSWRERKFRRDLKTSVVKVLECAQHAAQRGKELAESLHALVEFASLIPRDFEGEATPDAVCEHSMQRESSCALARDIRARVAARSSRCGPGIPRGGMPRTRDGKQAAVGLPHPKTLTLAPCQAVRGGQGGKGGAAKRESRCCRAEASAGCRSGRCSCEAVRGGESCDADSAGG